MVEGSVEYSDCQLIVANYIEMELGPHQNIKFKLRGEVKNYRKNCVNTGEGSTIGVIELMPERHIIACVINPID